MTLLSFYLFRGVNIAKGGFIISTYFVHELPFATAILTLAIGMPR
jgi:hypothetical protein